MDRSSNMQRHKEELGQYDKFQDRGRYRTNRKSSNISYDSTTTSTELEGTSQVSTNVKSSRRSVSLTRYSTKITPALAAAMLSLPWPPPQKKLNEIQTQDKAGPAPGEEVDSDTDDKPLKEKIDATRSKSKPANMRKFYRKRRSQPPASIVAAADSANNNADEKGVQEYKPISIPKFKEVHTNWPGFEHEPIPNWKEKYMIAKPYPKTLDELPKELKSRPFYLSSKSSQMNVTNAGSNNGENGNEIKSRTQSKSKTEQEQGKSSSKPKKRLFVERIGSGTGCMK